MAIHDQQYPLRPILVTGSHRSGTTWVGRMLSAPPNIAYIHEPFNPLSIPSIGPLADGFVYVDAHNAEVFRPGMERLLEYRLHWRWSDISKPSDLARAWLLRSRSLHNRLRLSRPLVKDPMAVLSAEWLATTFHMDVVVTIRHPAAFVASVKRLSWRFDFGSLLRQEGLIEALLESHRDLIEMRAASDGDIVEESADLWMLIHEVIDRYRSGHPCWTFVRHEDLAAAPLDGFRNLYSALDIPYTNDVASTIRSASDSLNPVVPTRVPVHGVRRDSAATTRRWRTDLNDDEVRRIRLRTEPTSTRFYDDDEW